MNYRLATILARESHSTDTTKVIDLNLADPVSQIQIVAEITNYSVAGAPVAHPAKCVTKIELVDGSDVLFSLTGQEAQAADWYHRKQEAQNIICNLASLNSEMVFNINFGRFLYDPLFAFNPKKFTNPQLKITLDINGGGQNATAVILTVLAHIFDGKVVEPTGFFMHKEIKDYALAASTHEYTDLPTDYPYRKLFVRGQKYGTGPEYIFNTIKLSEDNDRKIPLYHTGWEILRAMVGQTKPYREYIIADGGGAGFAFYCTPCYWPGLSISHWESSAISTHATIWQGDGGRGYVYLSAVGGNYSILVEGWCPHGVIEIPFGLQDTPEDWYDVSKLGSLRLDILSASGMSSSESAQIFMQQLRKY